MEEGISYGWIAPTLLTLQKTEHFSLTTEELSWLGSIHELGKVVGPLLATLLIDRIGRRTVLLTCALIYFLSWFAISFSTSVLQICIARLAFGVSNGMDAVAASIYFGENFSPKLRAIFFSISLVAFYAAELVEFTIASWYSYKTVAAVNASVAFVGLLSMYFCRETPQYLLMQKNEEKAAQNYIWLRGIPSDTIDKDVEFNKIKLNVEAERSKTSVKTLLFSRANLRSLIIVSLVCAFTMGTGGAAVLSYVTMIFSTNSALTPYQFAILFAGVRLLTSATLPFYVEIMKRRTMIVGIFLMICLTHLCTAALYYVDSNVSPVENLSWYIFGTVTLYASIFTILSPLAGIIRGELFPQSVKAVGGFIAVSLLGLVGFITAKTFLVIKVNFGIYANFLLFAVMSFLGFVYTYFQLPETRGRMLVDIQKELEK